MTNAFSLFRSLIIYSVCLPLAIVVGYLLATPLDLGSLVPICMVLGLLSIPIFLRWHYPIMIVSWNMSAGLYFLPGKPSLALCLVFLSFGFSFLAFILNRNLKFIAVPAIARPLIFLSVVVLITARLTGGFGLSVAGSEAIGGKRYVFLLAGVVGFFALTARRIPADKVNLYIKLYFLGALTGLIGMTCAFISPSLYIIFLIFPADTSLMTSGLTTPGGDSVIPRLGNLALASMAVIRLICARFGLQGVLDIRKLWPLPAVLLLAATTLFGGFRSMFIEVALFFLVLFYLEGLARSRYLLVAVLTGLLTLAMLVPFADKLPMSVQRSLAVLPVLKIDPEATRNAQDTTEWRLEMWRNVVPTIPQYLILGKGLGMDPHDLAMLQSGLNTGTDTSYGSMIAGDYHNGPLSVIIPFGIPGAIGFIWFLVAEYRVLQQNFRHGDPSLRRINGVLFACFIVKTIMFLCVVGSLYSDLVFFTGFVGMSVALNGGVCKRAVESSPVPMLKGFRLVNAAR